MSNSGYRDIDEDWVDSSCNTDDLLEELEAMKAKVEEHKKLVNEYLEEVKIPINVWFGIEEK